MIRLVILHMVALIPDHSGVLFKLLTFSVMLGVVPIGSYFATLDYVWHGEYLFCASIVRTERLWAGNATMAAITAIVSANVVLLAYIILSIIEDGKAAKPVLEEPVYESRDESRKDK